MALQLSQRLKYPAPVPCGGELCDAPLELSSENTTHKSLGE
jgi:hypothetical protein